MSATDELRRLLDERGVEHHDMQYSYATEVWWGGESFGGGGDKFTAYEQTDGLICLEMADLTPEQAIAATLGRGECHRVRGRKSYRAYGGYRIECSECGYGLADKRYHFCPNCGRHIKED